MNKFINEKKIIFFLSVQLKGNGFLFDNIQSHKLFHLDK